MNTFKLHASIWIYPWDLLDEGINHVLDTIVDAGFASISIAVSYHSGKFLRPHGRTQRVYFCEDGVVYFRPNLRKYRESEIKPVPSILVEDDNHLTEIVSASADRGLDVIAWTVCLHNTRLGRLYLQYTVRNVYGDSYVYSLCPSRIEVRKYIASLVQDISDNYEVAAIELETPGYLPFRHGWHHEMYQVELVPAISTLLALCFCDACESRAHSVGIEVTRIKRFVMRSLEAFFRYGTTPRFTGKIKEEFDRFIRLRCEIVAGLVREARTAARGKELHVIPSIDPPLPQAYIEGSDLRLLSDSADAINILCYYSDIKTLRSDIAHAMAAVNGRSKLRVGLRPVFPDIRTKEELLDKLRFIAESGINGFSF